MKIIKTKNYMKIKKQAEQIVVDTGLDVPTASDEIEFFPVKVFAEANFDISTSRWDIKINEIIDTDGMWGHEGKNIIDLRNRMGFKLIDDVDITELEEKIVESIDKRSYEDHRAEYDAERAGDTGGNGPPYNNLESWGLDPF